MQDTNDDMDWRLPTWERIKSDRKMLGNVLGGAFALAFCYFADFYLIGYPIVFYIFWALGGELMTLGEFKDQNQSHD